MSPLFNQSEVTAGAGGGRWVTGLVSPAFWRQSTVLSLLWVVKSCQASSSWHPTQCTFWDDMHGMVFWSCGRVCVCACVCMWCLLGWKAEGPRTAPGRGKCFSVSGVLCELLKSPSRFFWLQDWYFLSYNCESSRVGLSVRWSCIRGGTGCVQAAAASPGQEPQLVSFSETLREARLQTIQLTCIWFLTGASRVYGVVH